MLPDQQARASLRRSRGSLPKSTSPLFRLGHLAGIRIAICCVAACTALAFYPRFCAAAGLTARQARGLICHMAMLELKSSAVRVGKVSAVDSNTAEATAEIETAFRLEKNEQDQWRVAEITTGQDRWEAIEFIVSALKSELTAGACELPEPAMGNSNGDPSVKRARCLVANLLDVDLPSDAVRIKEVSSFSLPFDSHPSALVEAIIRADFRFTREQKGSWRVNGVKTGNRNWFDPYELSSAVDSAKAASARADLQLIAQALEAFRVKRGFYVESKSEAVLIDFLSPTYLTRVIRLDPWRRPYLYEGSRDHFTLVSLGPDGKANTADDISLSGPGSSTRPTIHQPSSKAGGPQTR